MSAALKTQARTSMNSSLTPVQTGLLQRMCDCGGSAGLTGECEECANKELTVQRHADERSQPSAVPPIVHDVLRSPGQPLDTQTRRFMEPRFGHDFSHVRIHANDQAGRSAASVNAFAYTIGSHIVFRTGTYAPATDSGRELIAHELMHTIQQSKGLSGSGISQPADSSEREAAQVAKKVMVGGAGVPSVPAKANATIQRWNFEHGLGADELTGGPESIVGNDARVSLDAPFKLQRSPDDESAAPAGSDQQEAAAPSARANLIVEDDAAELADGQMRKSAFLGEVRAAVSPIVPENKADAFNHQFEVYSGYDSGRLERDIHTYAPETAGATAASEYIAAIRDHISQALATEQGSGSEATESAGGGGAGNGSSTEAPVMAKRDGGSQADSAPRGIQSQLGSGQTLDGGAKARMESAFGYDFSRVRVHTDAEATTLSTGLNARAFTIGSDIAFAAGEYQPGTMIGDALLAHELAHVVQQGGGGSSSASMQAGDAYQSLEEDADQSAVGAMIALWGGAKGALAELAKNAMPSLRSGLRLQRCNGGGPSFTARYRFQNRSGFDVCIYCACAPNPCSDKLLLTLPPDQRCPPGKEVVWTPGTFGCSQAPPTNLATEPCTAVRTCI